jgi:hypothetical protein
MAQRQFNVEILLKAVDRATRPIQDTEKLLKNLKSTAERTRTALTGALSFGIAAGAAALGAGLVASVKSASDLSESVSKMNVIFEDNAATVSRWASSSATALGLSKGAAIEAASGFGNLLKAQGMTGQATLEYSTSLTQLGADLASFNNTSVPEALQAISSLMAGETEPIKRYGVLMNETALKQKAVALGLASSTKVDLSPIVKSQAALALLFEKTKSAQGDFARTSNGMANQLRILQGQAGNLATTLGQFFLPIALQVIQGVNRVIGRLTLWVSENKGLLNSLGQTFSIVLGLVSRLFTGLSDAVGSKGANIGATLESIVKKLNSFLLSLKPLIDGVSRFVGGIREWVAQNPKLIETVAKAIAITAGLVLAFNAVRMAITAVRTAWLILQIALKANWIYLLIGAVVALGVVVFENFDAIKGWVLEAMNKIAFAIGFTAGYIVTLFKNMWSWAVYFTVTAYNGVYDTVSKLVTSVTTFFSDLWNRVKTTFVSFVAGAVSFALKLWEAIRTAPEKIHKLFYDLGAWLLQQPAKWLELGKNLGQGLLNGIISFKDTVVNAVKNIAQGAIDGFKNLLGIKSPSKVFLQFGGFIGEGLENGITRSIPKVSASVGSLGRDTVNNGRRSISDQLSRSSTNQTTTKSETKNYTFNLTLPNVSNADQFASELKTLLQGAL